MKTNLFKLVFVMLLGITVLGSCKKDDKEPEPVTPEITLSAPADGATFNMAAAENAAGITFTWTKDVQVTNYLLKISAEQSFATTVLDITGNQDSYLWTSTEIEGRLLDLEVGYEQSKTLYWTVTPASSDQEAITKTRSFTITRKQHPPKYGEWLFDDPADFGKAALGNDLEVKWGEDEVTKAQMFESVAGVSGSDKAVRVGYFGWFIARHGIRPIGNDPRINTYSVLYDVNFRHGANAVFGLMSSYVGYNHPQMHHSGDDNKLVCLVMSSQEISGTSNMWSADDADDLPEYFMPIDEWHRMIFRLDLVNLIMEAYVDGVLVATTVDANKERLIPNEGRWAWYPEGVVFFPPLASGGLQQEKKVDVSRLTIWDYCLTPAEIQRLGRAGDPTDIGED